MHPSSSSEPFWSGIGQEELIAQRDRVIKALDPSVLTQRFITIQYFWTSVGRQPVPNLGADPLQYDSTLAPLPIEHGRGVEMFELVHGHVSVPDEIRKGWKSTYVDAFTFRNTSLKFHRKA